FAARAASRQFGLVTWPLVAVVGSVLLAVFTAPLMSGRALAAADADLPPAALPAAAPAGWARVGGDDPDYVPDFKDANALATAVYARGDDRVTVTVHTYTSGNRELIRQVNTFAMQMGHKILRNVPVTIDAGAGAREVGRIDMLERGPRRSILYWYQVGERTAVSTNIAKVHEWLARVAGAPTRRAVVTLSTPTRESDVIPEALRDFAAAYSEEIYTCVVDPGGSSCAPARGDP
ncbi:MAG: exosortase C-terminal domain/associated protein EpsI, partial [Pseudomonadota bacterium]